MKPTTIAIIASVGAVAAVYLITRGTRAAVDTVGTIVGATGQAINPVNPENIFYSGTNAVGAVLTGQQQGEFSLGAWLWEKLNPEAVERERAILSNSPPPITGDRPAIGGGSRGFY